VDKIISLFAEQRASQRKLRSMQLERKRMQLEHKVVMLLSPAGYRLPCLPTGNLNANQYASECQLDLANP
jgi:hypothetical protein